MKTSNSRFATYSIKSASDDGSYAFIKQGEELNVLRLGGPDDNRINITAGLSEDIQLLNKPSPEKDILKNAVLFDIETLGTQTQSVHEMSLFDLENKQLTVFLPENNLIRDANKDIDSFNMVSNAKKQKIDVLKDLPNKAKLSFKDIAFADFLMNRRSYTELIKDTESKAENQKFIDLLNNIKNIDENENLNAVQREKNKAALIFNDENLNLLRDKDLLDRVGFNKKFERDNYYLSRYILQGSEAFKKFKAEQPALSTFYEYLSKPSGTFDETQLRSLMQSYIGNLGNVGKYTAEQLKGVDVKFVQGMSMESMLQEVAKRMENKTVFIANAAFESKQIGAQIQASVEDKLEKAIENKKTELGLSADQDLPKKVLSAVKRQVYEEYNPFGKVGIPGSTSTGEPFYVSGIKYNAASLQGKMTGDFKGLAKEILHGTAPGDVRDILDIFRTQQSILSKYNVTDINRPIALSVEMQGRLHLFTELLMKGASQEELRTALSKFKETHTSSLDVMIHETTALKQSVVQTEALFEYMNKTERGKALFQLAKSEQGALYQAVAYGKVLQDLSPKLEQVALQQRVVTNLKQVEQFGYATEAKIKGMTYKEQQSTIKNAQYGDIHVAEKIPVADYERVSLTNYSELKKSILEQEIYDYKGKPEDFKAIENDLFKEGFIKKTGDEKYEFIDELLNQGDQSQKALDERERFRAYIKTQETKVSQSIESIEDYSRNFNLTSFKNNVNKFFGMTSLEDISIKEYSPGISSEKISPTEKASKEVTQTIKAASQHLNDARSHFMSMMQQFIGEPQVLDIQQAIADEKHVISQINNVTTDEVRGAFYQYGASGSFTLGGQTKNKPSSLTEIADIQKQFTKDYLEAIHYDKTKISQPYASVREAQQTSYISGQKQLLRQAAERNLLLGPESADFEKQINQYAIYGKKTIGEYRQDFENYKKTGEIKTSYGVTLKDDLFDEKANDTLKAKQFAQSVFETEESAFMQRGSKGEIYRYSEPEIKNFLVSGEVPKNTPSAIITDTPPAKIEKSLKPTSVDIKTLSSTQAEEIAKPILKRNLNQGLDQVIKDSFRNPKVLKGLGIYAAGAATLGIIGANQAPIEREKGLISEDYNSWLENQTRFFGSENNFKSAINQKYENTFDGFPEKGMASYLRKKNTDFGSPYQGPEVSYTVFDNQRLMNERRKYNRQMFTERNLTQGGEIYDMLRSFVSFRPKFQTMQHLYSEHEQPSEKTLASLHNTSKLVKLKVNDEYEINVDDADTITLQRKGVPNNSLAAFMGSNSFSFRLAGIDAPETAHEGREAQPHAERSKKLLQNLINKGDLEIIVDPENVTYGRQVATLFSGGKNLNLELIRQGAVSYLPYKGKGQTQMYDQKAYAAAHKYASEANRGMWAEPYFQVYADMMRKTGQSITFNTLVNAQETAKNSITMNVAAEMQRAQREGVYGESSKQEVNQIAEDIKDRKNNQINQPNIFKSLGLRKQYQQEKTANPLKDELAERFIDGSLSNQKYNSHLDEMSYDLKKLIESKGSKNLNNKLKTTGSSKKNNLDLIDSGMSAQKQQSVTSNNPEMYNDREKRILRQNAMQTLQHKALLDLKASPINHHRM